MNEQQREAFASQHDMSNLLVRNYSSQSDNPFPNLTKNRTNNLLPINIGKLDDAIVSSDNHNNAEMAILSARQVLPSPVHEEDSQKERDVSSKSIKE